jgi:hypothetical protein
MELSYQTPPTRASGERRVYAALLKVLIAYFLLSSVTLPFVPHLWLGELPVLALIQSPKLMPAHWLRTDVVMPAIRRLGLSRGSFSPDYSMAGPYALAITYLLPLAALVAVVWLRTRIDRPFPRLTLLLLAVAALDCLLTLLLSDTRSLTIY